MNKKVSIILPVYNAEDYLERCLNSILQQDYPNIELIATNDGSSDSSWDILEKYKNKYPSRMIIINQSNKGVSITRNNMINMATGDYLLIIDNDDYFDEGYITRYVNEIQSGDYDVVVGGYKRPNENNKIVEQVKLKNYEYSKFKIVAAWGKIYKLDYIRKNDIRFLNSNIGEDINFTIQAVTLTKKIKIIDYVGYNWFYNTESVSNTAHKNLTNGLQFDFLLNSIYDKLVEKNVKIDDYIEYYFIKLNVWFMLYSTKKVPMKLVKETMDSNFNWLKERFPNYNKNKYLPPLKLKGDVISQRMIVWTFIRLMDYNCINLFMRLYCNI